MNVLKLLFNPIFLLAAGLHAGLLLIPVAGGSSDTAVPAPDPEGESITVTRIPPKTTQSAKSADQSAPSRPTPAGATAVRPSTAGGQTVKATSQGRPQTAQQTNQDASVDRTTANRRRSNNGNHTSDSTAQSNQTDSRNSSNEISVLPADDSANSASTDTNRTSPASQAPPTLVALKNGTQSEIPNGLRNFLARLRHSVLRTTDPEVEEAKQKWLATLNEQPGLHASAPQALDKAVEIRYPITPEANGSLRRFVSCLTPEPEKGLVGVVVDANGTISAEPTLLRSSGYDFLNDIALEKVKTYDSFPDERSQKMYTVPVEVEYDKSACIDLADLQTN
ncbi:MAG: hypothetical protein AAGF93_09515 [Cyanobacteria bacterium P01_H01_bin.105]